MLTTVVPSLTSEVLRFVNLASHSLSTGERWARSISARKFPNADSFGEPLCSKAQPHFRRHRAHKKGAGI